MPQIEFRENKILKLNNVLSRKVPEKEIMNQEKQVQMLINWVKAKGYETVGPLIFYSSGVKRTVCLQGLAITRTSYSLLHINYCFMLMKTI